MQRISVAVFVGIALAFVAVTGVGIAKDLSNNSTGAGQPTINIPLCRAACLKQMKAFQKGEKAQAVNDNSLDPAVFVFVKCMTNKCGCKTLAVPPCSF